MDFDAYIDFDPDRARAAPDNPSIADKPTKVVRKKFAVPPVKVACLEW